MLCAVCSRFAKYAPFGWYNPKQPRKLRVYTHLCCMSCQDRWAKMMSEEGTTIGIAEEEVKAIELSLPAIGRLVAQIENGRPLSSWEKEEILRLLFSTVREYQFQMNGLTHSNEPPFK